MLSSWTERRTTVSIFALLFRSVPRSHHPNWTSCLLARHLAKATRILKIKVSVFCEHVGVRLLVTADQIQRNELVLVGQGPVRENGLGLCAGSFLSTQYKLETPGKREPPLRT